MSEPEESLCSRRRFVRNALIGAAGTLTMTIHKHAAQASTTAEKNLSHLSISQISQLVRSKKVSPVELTRECLSRIERLNRRLNAFITLTADSALAEARQAAEEIRGER